MTFHLSPPIAATMVADLRFLVAMCNGPEKFKLTVADWTDWFELDEDRAWTIDSLKAVCEALVTLAHANASFSRVTPPFFYRGSAGMDVQDRGGFLLAKKTLFRIIDSASLCNECRGELLSHVLKVAQAQMTQLEKIIPRR